ncbi:MAG: FAD-dependent oxidoreductase [Myxococcota bacterium]
MKDLPLAPPEAPTVVVVGGGAAGLLSAHALLGRLRLVVLEAADRLGGGFDARSAAGQGVDLGVRFFAEKTHPTFHALVQRLGLPILPISVDVTLHDAERGDSVVLPPSTPSHVAAIARRPSRAKQLLRFRKLADEALPLVRSEDWSLSVAACRRRFGWSDGFHAKLFAPWAGASIGVRNAALGELAAYPILRHFVDQQPEGTAKPVWGHLAGGLGTFADVLSGRLQARDDVQLVTGAPVTALTREGDRWRVRHGAGDVLAEAVVFAVPAEVARPLVAASPAAERAEPLGAFRYGDLDIVVHGDAHWMPKKRSDWSLYNVLAHRDHGVATVWEGRDARADLFMSWCPAGSQPRQVHARRRHRVWLPTPGCGPAQAALASRQGEDGLAFAGSWTAGIDTLESVARSAEAASAALGVS